jgi:hypothetical protein
MTPRRPPAVSPLPVTVAAMELRHVCEVCGVEAILTPEAACKAGWDYPPKIGSYQVISQRTCPDCPTDRTVWWALAVDGYTPDMLSPAQRATVDRILGEPGSISVRRARGFDA